MSLGSGRGSSDSDGNERFCEPDAQPGFGGVLVRSSDCGADSGKAHGDTAPAGYGSEFRGALHGFTDVAKVIGGASVDGDGRAFRGVERGGGHKGRVGEWGGGCQVLCNTKSNRRKA